MRIPHAAGSIAIGLLIAVGQSAAAQSPLRDANYETFSGFVNDDNHIDVLLVPKQRIVLIGYDILIPVFLQPAAPALALMSRADGSYQAQVDPPRSLIDDPAWRADTHELLFASTLGDGTEQMMVRSLTDNGASFLIALDTGADSLPYVLQELSPSAAGGIDLGAPGTTVELSDSNGDGRDDLLIRVDGLLVAVVFAGPSGAFEFPEDEEGGTVAMTWRTFCIALEDADVASALYHVHSESLGRYTPSLTELGELLSELPGTLSEIREIGTENGIAEYSVEQSTPAGPLLFIITFKQEDGRWKVSEF